MDIDSAIVAAAEKLDAEAAPEPAAEAAPAPEAVETPQASAPQDGAPQPSASQRERDERGRFAPKTGDGPAEKSAAAPKGDANGAAAAAPPAGEAKAGGAEPPAAPPAEAAKPAEPAVRAPQSWRPAAREAWAKIPPEAQAEIARVENATKQALREAADDRKAAQRFHQVVAPYEQQIRSRGADPLQVFANTLPTIVALESPDPSQRAQHIARIVQTYLPGQQGIDLLAAALDGKAPSAPVVDPATIAAQAEQRVFQRLQAQAAQAAAQRQEAMLSKFAEAHPFFEDVRYKMSDILAARGTPNPSEQELAEVYDLACSLDPEVSRILKQRDAARSAQTAQAATARAKAAASSVKSNPGAAAPRTQLKGIDAAMAAAAEKLGM